MKVKCLSNNIDYLTKNREYYVLEEKEKYNNTYYRILDDEGKTYFYNEIYFQIVNNEDNINPSHYLDFEIPPTEYIIKNNLDFLEGNVIKYVTRHKLKNKEEDIKKAIKYLEIMLENYKKLY